MSLIIQQEELNQEILPPIGLSNIKKILNIPRILDSNYYDQLKQGFIKCNKILELCPNYKFLLQINITAYQVHFQTTLIKNGSEVIIQETKSKVMYWRLLLKYLPSKRIKIFLSKAGQMITKQYFPLQKLNLITSDRKQTSHIISRLLVEFIGDSVAFYKKLIPKIDQNIIQINKMKPQYLFRQSTCSNICNHSFLPTFGMFKKNIDSSDSKNLFHRFKRSPKTDEILKNILKQNMVYHQSNQILFDIKSYYNSKCDSYMQFNLEKIYFDLLGFQQKKKQSKSSNFRPSKSQNTYSYYKIFISNLDFSHNKKGLYSQSTIYNLIEIINPQKLIWEDFQSTSLSFLKIAKIKYINKRVNFDFDSSIEKKDFSSIETFQSNMVLKLQNLNGLQKQKSKINGQLKWEKSIIEICFQNQSCLYIPKFFFTKQKIIPLDQNNQMDFLLSEYMKKGNLWNWINQHGHSSSIFTKINIILYILYGLTFIHSKKILHLDLKPLNILMDKNLVPKITDFGSAYNKDVYENMKTQKVKYFLSFSIPYTAPEIFMKVNKPSLNPKCDIYSIGLIIFEILFNNSIFTQPNQILDKIYKIVGEKLDKQTDLKEKQKIELSQNIFGQDLLQKIYWCPEILEGSQSQTYNLLINVIHRCLSCNEQKRPYLGFLIIAIKQIYQLFIDYHTW